MQVLRNLLVNIAADSNPLSDLNREMREMNNLTSSGSSELNKMNKQSGMLGKTMKGAAIGVAAIGAAAVGAIAAVVKIGPSLVEAAAAASAMSAQFETVFGDIQKDAQKTIDGLGKSFGMAPNRIKPALTQMTSMFKGLGLDTEDAMATAKDAVTLTADAAAFYDKSFEDANSALNSFIKGNYEGGEAIGLFGNETQLAAFAAENGHGKFKDLGEAQKQLIRIDYAKAMQESAGATGQAARESNSLENQLGNLRSAWEDMKVKFGTPILEPTVTMLQKMAAGLQDINTEPAVAALESFVKSGEDMAKKAGAIVGGMKGLFSGTSLGMVDFQSAITKAFGQEGGLKVINFFLGVKDSIDTVAPYLDKARGLFSGVVAAFQGNTGKSAGIMSALGLSSETIVQVQGVVSQIVDEIRFRFSVIKTIAQGLGKFFVAAFQYLVPIIIPALQEVLNFAGGVMLKIRNFWESDGQQLMAAVGNVFKGIFAVIKFIMPAVLGIIKMFWGNIKGVINGALNIIMGAVKIFSGLFTGDFGKIWEGVKQLFVGAVEFIWNFVQLTFYGKILGGVKAFVIGFRTQIVNLWKGIVQLFQGNVVRAERIIKVAWGRIYQETTRIFTNIWTFLINTWNSIRSITAGAFNGIKIIFTQGWSFVRNTTTSIFSSVWTFISGTASKIFNAIKSAWGFIRNSTSSTFGEMFNTVKTRFTNIVDAAKALPGRIGDGIGSMASKVKSGVTSVINTLSSTLGKGVNGVIGGVNWVLGKIGVDSLVPVWDIPQWANGTGNGSHPGGPALINDGKGSNAGRELIRTPDGTMGMFEGKNIVANLPKGTQVLSATETRGALSLMPQYNSGTEENSGILGSLKNVASDLYSGAKNIGGKVLDTAFSVFDYIKNPSELLDLAMNTLGIGSPEGGSLIGDMAKGAFNKVKGGAVDFVKKKLDMFSAAQNSGIALTGGNGGGFGAPFRLTSRPGARNTGILGASRMHKGWDWAAPVGTPIPSVSNGVVTRNSYNPISGKFVEISSGGLIHRYQHNSRNAVNVGQQVAKGQTVGYVGSTGVSSGPHLHYEVKKGFAKGTSGPLKKATTAWVGERGPELMHLNKGTEIFSNNESKRMEGRGYSTAAPSPAGGIFAPEINVIIQGNADRETASLVAERVRAEVEEVFASMNRRFSFSREG